MLSTEGAVGHCPRQRGYDGTALFLPLTRWEAEDSQTTVEDRQKEKLAALPWKSDAASPTSPQGTVLMASASVPGMHGWGNLYNPSLPSVHGLSLCHGGGLRAPFFFACRVAGIAAYTKPRELTSSFFPHLIQRYVSAPSRFLVRPPTPDARISPPVGGASLSPCQYSNTGVPNRAHLANIAMSSRGLEC
jgi:hypothetical protein